MKFGRIPVADADGAISAHSIKQDGVVIRKGALLRPADLQALRQGGVDTLVAVRLENDDIGEDEAAGRLAATIAGPNLRVEPPFTGRSNLFATRAGLLCVDTAAIDAANAVDEAVTVATLPAYKPVVEGEMVGTVKIIPYAVPAQTLAGAIAAAGRAALDVAPYRLSQVGAVSTITAGLKPSVVTKTIAALNARLARAGARVVADASCAHDTTALAAELRIQAAGPPELIVVFGASAISDRRDVIPAALVEAGGTIEHFGMPVDPGNLLLIGRIGDKPVIGAPGCARSPKENGFDWILGRLLAGIAVTRADIMRLGVGGLLMEIVSRPQPRRGGTPEEDE